MESGELQAGNQGRIVRAANVALGAASHVGGARWTLAHLADEAKPQMTVMFSAVAEASDRSGVLFRFISYCAKNNLHDRLTDPSSDGFSQAMDVSVRALVRHRHVGIVA